MKETRKRSLVTLVTKVKAAVSLALCVIFRGIAERAPWSPASYRLPWAEAAGLVTRHGRTYLVTFTWADSPARHVSSA